MIIDSDLIAKTEKVETTDSEVGVSKLKLFTKFAFWYRLSDDLQKQHSKLDQNEYGSQVKKIAEFDTV